MNKTKNLINTSHMPFHSRENKLSVCYSGIINPKSIYTLFTQVENYFDFIHSPSDIKKKILGIITELLQNIYHHSPPIVLGNTEYLPSFLLEQKGNSYVFTASNIISKKNELSLKKQLSNLNFCSPEEIKKQYQNRLKNGDLINGHAGLGWIDICRKSGNPILYKFTPKGNNYSLFTVNITA